MERINTNADNSEVQQLIDDHLEKVVQDFNEFREKISLSSSGGALKLEDLVDLYVNNGGENSYSPSQTTGNQFTAILEDFNEFESTLPSHQVEPPSTKSSDGLNFDTEIQENEMMINEMADNSSQNDTESFPASSQTVSISSHVGVGSSSKQVTYIRYGDLNCHRAGGGGNEVVFGSVMRFIRNYGGGEMNFWPHVGVNENANKCTPRRKRVKRKYRGVIETEEETARRLERTKVKNREAAAKANADRQVREAYIKTQLSNLRRKNEFLKKLVTFLEDHKRINLGPEPLRRTISGPQEILIKEIQK